MKNFAPLFVFYRKDQAPKARQYLSGLMQAGTRKNMERMVEVVPDSDHQAIQQFISNSQWDASAVMDTVAQQANEQIGNKKNACLLINESGFAKKGKKSVGVARQWLGNLGKVDNGQVGVYASLCNDKSATLINTRLYLPSQWTDDKARCKEAGVPAERLAKKHQTKEDLALELIEDARRLELEYAWIGADAGYGKGLDFMLQIDKMGEIFMIDVHKDQLIFEDNPAPHIPQGSGKGRKPTVYQVQTKPIRLDKWTAWQSARAWRSVVIRDSTKGDLTYEVLTKRIWVWKDGDANGHCFHVVVRRDPVSKGDYKYSLSNASQGTSRKRLAYMQAQRFWIERAFEDAKSECGMADYQLRGWTGWHHHMALVMMAMLFMLNERIINKADHPLLSCADIEGLLARFLPRRDTSIAEVLAQLDRRHKQRRAAIESAKRSSEIKIRGG